MCQADAESTLAGAVGPWASFPFAFVPVPIMLPLLAVLQLIGYVLWPKQPHLTAEKNLPVLWNTVVKLFFFFFLYSMLHFLVLKARSYAIRSPTSTSWSAGERDVLSTFPSITERCVWVSLWSPVWTWKLCSVWCAAIKAKVNNSPVNRGMSHIVSVFRQTGLYRFDFIKILENFLLSSLEPEKAWMEGMLIEILYVSLNSTHYKTKRCRTIEKSWMDWKVNSFKLKVLKILCSYNKQPDWFLKWNHSKWITYFFLERRPFISQRCWVQFHFLFFSLF